MKMNRRDQVVGAVGAASTSLRTFVSDNPSRSMNQAPSSVIGSQRAACYTTV
jgi:hypothetical protein